MGTTYHIKVVSGYFQSVSGLKEKIEKRLVEINAAMSTYQKDSEISRFNEFNQTGRKFKISADFYRVMEIAQDIYQLSDGAWDATVNPLVDLWGFGRGGAKNKIPLETEISALLSNIGFENIEIQESRISAKKARRCDPGSFFNCQGLWSGSGCRYHSQRRISKLSG